MGRRATGREPHTAFCHLVLEETHHPLCQVLQTVTQTHPAASGLTKGCEQQDTEQGPPSFVWAVIHMNTVIHREIRKFQ